MCAIVCTSIWLLLTEKSCKKKRFPSVKWSYQCTECVLLCTHREKCCSHEFRLPMSSVMKKIIFGWRVFFNYWVMMKVNFCTIIRDGKEPKIFGLCSVLVLWREGFSLGSECLKKFRFMFGISSVNIGFGFFIYRIGNMFPWGHVTDYL